MSDPKIDEALAEIEWVRRAKKRHDVVVAMIESLRRSESAFSAHSVENMVERCALEKELQLLRPVALNHEACLVGATERLWRLNGVLIKSTITKELGDVVLKRLSQGYSNRRVAVMMGCAPGTVSRIKSGHYRYSELPAATKIGGRGR